MYSAKAPLLGSADRDGRTVVRVGHVDGSSCRSTRNAVRAAGVGCAIDQVDGHRFVVAFNSAVVVTWKKLGFNKNRPSSMWLTATTPEEMRVVGPCAVELSPGARGVEVEESDFRRVWRRETSASAALR